MALIGIYGSVATGDDYAKSDLDLLILIENEEGRKLATGFILDDSGVGCLQGLRRTFCYYFYCPFNIFL